MARKRPAFVPQGEKEKMIAYITSRKCETERATMDFYLNRNATGVGEAEIGGHLKVCSSCRAEWKARLSLKNKLKRAVNHDFAPPSLFEAIRRQIREQ